MDGGKLSSTLKDIGQTLKIEHVTTPLQSILANPSTTGGQMGVVVPQVINIKNGITDILSANPATKLKGLLTIVSAVRTLVPIVVPHVKEFARFVSSILGLSVNGQTIGPSTNQTGHSGKTAETVTTIILNALDEKEDESLNANAESACRVLSFAHNIIIGVGNDSNEGPSRSEASDLLGLIDINAGVKALGKVESRILSLMKDEPKTKSEEAMSTYCRRVIKYIDMYCHLAILRDAVMWELYAVLTYSGQSDCLAEGVRTGLEGEHERDRKLVKALVLPNQSQVRFASFFDPDSWPFTYKFMGNCKDFHAFENLDKVPVAMNTMQWMNWFVIHDKKPGVCLRALKSPSAKPRDKTIHNFVLLMKEGSAYYYISPQDQKDTYVVMSGGVTKWVEVQKGRPGKEGEWNIFNVQDNNSVYMLSTRRWPVHFMTMSGTLKGWLQGQTVSVSDPSAHWLIQYNGSKV